MGFCVFGHGAGSWPPGRMPKLSFAGMPRNSGSCFCGRLISTWSCPKTKDRPVAAPPLELVKKLVPETPFILLTSRPDCDGAVRALCAGASECVFKDRMEMLAPAIGRAVARRMEALRARHLERQCLSLANMLRQTFDVVVAEDQGGRISFWNRAAEQLLGWTPGEASGLAITSYAARGAPPGLRMP